MMMEVKMRNIRKLILIGTMLIMAGLNIPFVLADEVNPAPDKPLPVERSSVVEVVDGESITTVIAEVNIAAPNSDLNSPNGLVPGPGGESVNLAALLQYSTGLFGSFKGGARINNFVGSPSARAWAFLFYNSTHKDTSDICWGPCTTWTYSWSTPSSGTIASEAHTEVNWSSGGTTNTHVTASHTF